MMVKRIIPLTAFPLFLLLSFSLLFSSPTLVSGEEGDLMTRALELKGDGKESEALQVFEIFLHQQPDNYQALLNAAFLHFRQGWLYSKDKEKKEHYLKLAEYAHRASVLKPGEYQARLVNLVAKAKTSGYLAPGDQVRVARELQQELAQFTESGLNDPDVIYILSWLNFKVGKVSSLEKMLAALIFGGLPENLTTDKAIELMEKAIDLRPDYSVYYYDLGLFRQRLGQSDQARALFQKVVSMVPEKAEEVVYRQWAERRLIELDGQKVASN